MIAIFDVVDLTVASIVTRGGEYGDRPVVESIDTTELARQLDALRSDLSTVLDESETGIGPDLKS